MFTFAFEDEFCSSAALWGCRMLCSELWFFWIVNLRFLEWNWISKKYYRIVLVTSAIQLLSDGVRTPPLEIEICMKNFFEPLPKIENIWEKKSGPPSKNFWPLISLIRIFTSTNKQIFRCILLLWLFAWWKSFIDFSTSSYFPSCSNFPHFLVVIYNKKFPFNFKTSTKNKIKIENLMEIF